MNLLPCPFCGAGVSFQQGPTYCDRNLFPDWRIGCVPCGISTEWERGEDWGPRKGTFSLEDQAKKKLATRWNRRK